jgi:hypothetical protein
VPRWARAWPGGHALAALLAAYLLIWPSAGWGGSAAMIDHLGVHLGFDGIIKIGVPVPLEVVIPPLDLAGPAEFAVDAPALGPEAGRVVTTTVVPFRAVAGVPQLLHATVTVNDPRRPLIVRVSVAGREVLRTTVAVSPERAAGRLLAALTDDRAGLGSLSRLGGRVGVAYLAGRALPRRWQEYAAIDLAVVRDLDPASLDASQEDALLTWVQLGGRLLVIARPSSPTPPWLQAIMPASAGETRTIQLPAGVGPTGEVSLVALSPRGEARRVVAGDLTVMAAAPAGQGRVTVSGLDPWQPQFLQWSGRLDWWDNAMGKSASLGVDPAAVAETLPAGTPLPLPAHAQAGGAVFLYVGLVLVIRRRWATLSGAAWSALVALAAIGAFALLAEATRAHSAMVTQAAILEGVSGARTARATTIGAVAVPYGGRYRLLIDGRMVVQPLTPSADLRIELSRSGTVIEGSLRSGEAARPFVAVGAVPLAVSATLSPDGGRLVVDLAQPARRVEIRRGDRVYPVGDLPAGRSSTEIHAGGWIVSTGGERTGGEFSQRLREAIFHAPPSDAILSGARAATTPLLVAELEGVPSTFALGGAAAPGQRLTVLVVPLERK